MNDFSATCTCPICKKQFFVWDVDNYGWSFGDDLYCSYGCMRKAEKRYFDFLDGAFVTPKRRLLPFEYRSVYDELMYLRSLVKMQKKYRRLYYRDNTDEQQKIKIKLIVENCSKKISFYKKKYAFGVSKLSKTQFQVLSKYVLSCWSRDKLSIRFNRSYDEICDQFLTIMDTLKTYRSCGCSKFRWACA